MADQELLALVKRLEAVATKLEGSVPGGPTSGKFDKWIYNLWNALIAFVKSPSFIVLIHIFIQKKIVWFEIFD